MKEPTTKSAIYSIGHGAKSIDRFVRELASFDIKYLLDIRSKPYSKWSPQYNQNTLKASLKTHDITYVYVGDQLGGLPDDSNCYDEKGKVVYDKLKEKSSFKEGLERLITANSKRIKVAIMCNEPLPKECHRSKLIGEVLLKKFNISVNHIVKEKVTKSQEEVVLEVTGGLNTIDCFGNTTSFKSRKSH